MQQSITKVFKFEAAHQLPNHDGKCRNLHGHTYRVELDIEGPVCLTDGTPKEGMIVDFSDVSKLFKELVFNVCDHSFLNESLPVDPTTAENISLWIFDVLNHPITTLGRGSLADAPALTRVRVWETSTSYAEVRRT